MKTPPHKDVKVAVTPRKSSPYSKALTSFATNLHLMARLHARFHREGRRSDHTRNGILPASPFGGETALAHKMYFRCGRTSKGDLIEQTKTYSIEKAVAKACPYVMSSDSRDI